ncbi:MAG: hypothetical protein FWD17_06910 [Polyangiaceae bacterium]|nr:hypothetical protein [Polyangiaceae bacterium]
MGCLALAAGVASGACKDHGKESAAHADQDDAFLADLVDKDVAEVERGLPEGAKKLAPLVAEGADPRQDTAAVRKALGRMRHDVMDLNIAKSTFFALADSNGVAVRNDLEEDVMAGQDLIALFPALARARDGYVATTGRFPNAVSKNGPDKDWIAGAPVRRENGTTGAIVVTGWSYRFFARHLHSTLESRLIDQAKAAGAGSKLPVYYVALFDSSGVYSAPLTPAVDEQALAGEGLAAKTAAGPVQGVLTITDREFGYAARRTPKLGADTGVVVLRSEI